MARTDHVVNLVPNSTNSAWGAACTKCGSLGGAYFTKGGAMRLAQEHNEKTVTLSFSEWAVICEALRIAETMTHAHQYASMLAYLEDEAK